MNICVYYEQKKGFILDIIPREIKPEVRAKLEEVWTQPILRKILIEISQGHNRLPKIKERIGHSASTLHEAVKKLVDAGFVKSEMIYEGNKQKILTSNVLCACKNNSSRASLQKFFQGLWVDSKKTRKIIEKIQSKPKRWWSPEELSAATNIPVDEITLLMSNFDSLTTRGLSQFLKEPPFEKKIMYKAH